MANKTGIASGLYAGIVNTGLFMAFGAIIHLHAIPRIPFQPGDIMSPDIPAVTRDPILLIRLKAFALAYVAMADRTVEFGAINMGRM